MKRNYSDLLSRLWKLHKLRQKKLLISEGVNLHEFLDFAQEQLIMAKNLNSREFINGKWNVEIAEREKLQDVIAELIEASNDAGMTQPLLATIYWCNGDPIEKDNDIAKRYGWRSAASLYRYYLRIIKDVVYRRNPKRLQLALPHLKKPKARDLCKQEIALCKK
jgi:hypothetical protein